jgi:hypothetical protein
VTKDKEIENLRNTIRHLYKRLENSDSELLLERNKQLEKELINQSKLVGGLLEALHGKTAVRVF